MLKTLKRLVGFGGREDGPAWFDEELYKAKLAAFEGRLGKSANEVIAAIIGWGMGGPVDLWIFPEHAKGTFFTTMQLAVPGERKGQRKNSMGSFELAAATRYQIDKSPQPAEGQQKQEEDFTAYERAMFDIRTMLSNIAYYSYDAVLEPNETGELPAENEEDTIYLVMDALIGATDPVQVNGEDIGVLMCIRVHESELEFARQSGTTKLIQRLKEAGHYPYSDLDREPVA